MASVIVALLGATVAVVMMWWTRSEARRAYRRDRASLRRIRRRWSRVGRRLTDTERSRHAARIRALELSLRLARQGLRSRRRTTGLVWFVRTLRERRPVPLETPFERAYLVEAHLVLVRLTSLDTTATVIDLAPVDDGTRTGPDIVAEPA